MGHTETKKILIIEDEKSYGRILVERLQRESFDVVLAANGEEGIDLALKQHPDLIVLDMIMPKMGGLAFLKLLYADAWGASARVIILSNHDKADDIAQALIVSDENSLSSPSQFVYLSKVDVGLEEFVTKVRQELFVAEENK